MHKHEWGIWQHGEVMCIHCMEEMSNEEAEARLNAKEETMRNFENEYWEAQAHIDELYRILQLLETDSRKLQCLDEAGIDNVEAYSIGMQLYYERWEPEDA